MRENEARDTAVWYSLSAAILSYVASYVALSRDLVTAKFDVGLETWQLAGWALHAAFGSDLSASTPDGQGEPSAVNVGMEALFTTLSDLEAILITIIFLCAVGGLYRLNTRVSMLDGVTYIFFFTMLYGLTISGSSLVLGETFGGFGATLRYSPSGEAGVAAGIITVAASGAAVITILAYQHLYRAFSGIRSKLRKLLETD